MKMGIIEYAKKLANRKTNHINEVINWTEQGKNMIHYKKK